MKTKIIIVLLIVVGVLLGILIFKKPQKIENYEYRYKLEAFWDSIYRTKQQILINKIKTDNDSLQQAIDSLDKKDSIIIIKYRTRKLTELEIRQRLAEMYPDTTIIIQSGELLNRYDECTELLKTANQRVYNLEKIIINYEGLIELFKDRENNYIKRIEFRDEHVKDLLKKDKKNKLYKSGFFISVGGIVALLFILK